MVQSTLIQSDTQKDCDECVMVHFHQAAVGRINVLHLVHAFQTGGAERVVLDLTRYGSPAVVNSICSFREPHDLALQLDKARTSFWCLNKREGNDPRVITKVAGLIDDLKIDVVHAQGWGTFLEGLVAAKWFSSRRPAFIYAFHGKTLDDVTRGVPASRRIAQRIAHHWTDACIAPAGHMAEEYARTVGLAREKIELIHNGVDVQRFGCELFRESRQALGLAPDDFVIGFVGRLDPVKNITGILEIFVRFRNWLDAQQSRTRLLIVGDGVMRSELERSIANYGLNDSIVLTGMRTDIPLCMSAMDIYLQPSFYEGHSVTILEALATGLPVVSTSVGGTPEIICHGTSGFLFHPHEHDLMAQAILHLFQEPNLAADIGRRGRKRVAECFSVTKMIENYERLYKRVLKIGE